MIEYGRPVLFSPVHERSASVRWINLTPERIQQVIICYLFRIIRSNAIETLNMEFVRVLYARGISTRQILFKHVFRNVINPMITMLGFQLPALVSGAALVEIITGWPGLGTMMLHAVRSQDIYLVMGNILMISFLLIVGNLIADILLAINDPRIRQT